ncbi:restriction of telomere capping protein 5 [Hyaloscypha hepaticicola]|uniref:Restriction of telomere capping protein 5 n=1 Tax=Hyaloscypha hepaticicola TaxID=2082293 RepID=A0A2J6PGX4_9HELO|nr:restriction of telomere capping protein 5 [Hyaloscypha hepaticicola]
MGQGSSRTADPPSPEELALRLTNILAEKCFSPFELRCFKQTFKSLAEDQSGGVRYWPENTLVKFLELPDALGAGAVVYHLCSYIGAFPFPSHAPAVLTADALLRIVCFMTGRYLKVLHSGKEAWIRELWRACAVFEPEASTGTAKETDSAEESKGVAIPTSGSQGETAKAPTTLNTDQKEVGDDDEELAFHAFEIIDALEIYKQAEKFNIQRGLMPSEIFLKLVQLLLLLAPLGRAESVSLYTTQLHGRRLEGLQAASKCILASFGEEQNSGIKYKSFDAVVTNTLPHLFDSFDPLFEHFLFPKDLDVHKSKASAPENATPSSPCEASDAMATSQEEAVQISTPEPLLPVQGDVLDLNLLSQLSFIFSDKSIFHRLRPLYLGHDHGYSMGSLEKSVFKWRAPSILLVSGTILSPTTKQSHARAFLDELPHRRLSSSVNYAPNLESAAPSTESPFRDTQRIIYGAYIPVPWEATNKSTFGTDKTTLFQLSPVHDVFPASSAHQDYTYFNKPPSLYSGLGFGSPLATYSSMTASQHSLIGDEYVPLGSVSLHIDDALEFGVFTHVTSTVGSFQPSKLPASARAGNGADWQDRFEIDAIEVWGVGDANIAEEQRRAWLWETKEAERRKTVNLQKGDIDAERELLKMAGLMKDESRSGGSMG